MKKVLGILGLGSQSTLYCIKELNDKFYQLEKGFSTFPFMLLNTNFETINPYLPTNFDALLPPLGCAFQQLQSLDVSHILVPNITVHQALEKLQQCQPILHPIKLTLQHLKDNDLHEIMIFGTKATMESAYFELYFSKANIKMKRPTEEDIKFINDLRQRVYFQAETNKDISEYSGLLEKYTRQHYVVIACSELSLLKTGKFNPKVIDMLDLQIEEALALYYKKDF